MHVCILSESDYLRKKKNKIIALFLYFACLQLNVNYIYSLNLPYLHLYSQDENFYYVIFIVHRIFLREHNSACWFQLIPAKILFLISAIL